MYLHPARSHCSLPGLKIYTIQGKLSSQGAELTVCIFVALQENSMNVHDLPTQLPRTQPIHINRFLFKTFYSKGEYDSKIQAQPYPDT